MKSFIKMLGQIIRRLDYIIIYLFYCFFYKVNNRDVLFLSDSRDDLSGNFAFIYNYIKNDYHVTSYLKEHSHKMCKAMAQAHYIFVDDYYPLIYPIPLRKKTKLIQVWHAVGAFKTVGFARKNNTDYFSMTHRNYTDVIVSSESIRKDYAKAFRKDISRVHATGIPRTDIFFNEEYIISKKNELYQLYPILKSKKVILFAPTFRGNNVYHAYYDYDKIDFQLLADKLKDEYVCLYKMHPFVKNKPPYLDHEFYLDFSSFREINDLLLVTDVLITDYSSVIFEASLLHIYTIFYAYDLDDYISKRDFFYSYDEYTYGPVVSSTNSLIKAITENQMDEHKYQVFFDKFMNSCDGYATKRLVETLMEDDV